MRILVASSKMDFYKLYGATELVRNKLQNTAQVVNGEDVPWDSILETEGSWDEVYNWSARAFDALVVVETDEGGLGRGTYEMVKRFLDKNMSVGVIRGKEIKEVKEVRLFNKQNWTSNYGVVVT